MLQVEFFENGIDSIPVIFRGYKTGTGSGTKIYKTLSGGDFSVLEKLWVVGEIKNGVRGIIIELADRF